MSKFIITLGLLLGISASANAKLFACQGEFEYGTLRVQMLQPGNLEFKVTSYGLPQVVDQVEFAIPSPQLSALALVYSGTTQFSGDLLELKVSLNRAVPAQSEIIIAIGNYERHQVRLNCEQSKSDSNSSISPEVERRLPIEVLPIATSA